MAGPSCYLYVYPCPNLSTYVERRYCRQAEHHPWGPFVVYTNFQTKHFTSHLLHLMSAGPRGVKHCPVLLVVVLVILGRVL